VDFRLVTLVDTTRDDDHLDVRNARGEDQPLVIAVHHNHYANRTSGEAPAVLPGKELVPAIVWILDFDAEHLGEILSQAMGGRALDASSGRRDKALDGGRVQTPRELFVLRLDPRYNGDREELFVHLSVEVKDLAHFRVGFLFRHEGGVALLPQELASANERLRRLELPSDDAVPLVELQGEITIALYPLRVVYTCDLVASREEAIKTYKGTLLFLRSDG